MANQLKEPEKLFQALGDPTRLAVVQRLCRSPATVSELAQPHAMALPTFLRHLQVLEASGWVSSRKEGRVRTCQLNPQSLKAAGSWLEAQRTLWERRLDQLDDYLLKMKKEEGA